MKLLRLELSTCEECPLAKFNPGEKFFYCGHIDSPDDHVIKFTCDPSELDFVPEWCPLEDLVVVERDEGGNVHVHQGGSRCPK